MRNKINPIAAGVTGALLAGITGIIVVMLSDEKRRRKVGQALDLLGTKGKELAQKANVLMNKMGERWKEASRKVKREQRRISARTARA